MQRLLDSMQVLKGKNYLKCHCLFSIVTKEHLKALLFCFTKKVKLVIPVINKNKYQVNSDYSAVFLCLGLWWSMSLSAETLLPLQTLYLTFP